MSQDINSFADIFLSKPHGETKEKNPNHNSVMYAQSLR